MGKLLLLTIGGNPRFRYGNDAPGTRCDTQAEIPNLFSNKEEPR